MALKIERLPEFIDAVENELKMVYESDKHDGWRKLLLGERIMDVKNGVLDEGTYIAEWLNT